MRASGRKTHQWMARTLCLLLLLQGYPVLALQEASVVMTPAPPPVGEWVGSWLDGAWRRSLELGRAPWRLAWAPAWARVSAAGEELAWEWGVVSWAGLSTAGGGGDPQPPVPEKPSYPAAERVKPMPFEVSPELVAGKSALHEILK